VALIPAARLPQDSYLATRADQPAAEPDHIDLAADLNRAGQSRAHQGLTRRELASAEQVAGLQLQLEALLAEQQELQAVLGTSSPAELAEMQRSRKECASRAEHLITQIAALEAGREQVRAATGAGTAAEIIVLVEELRTHLAALVRLAQQQLDRRGQRLAEHERHIG
jgi:hypothetical protein